MERSKPRLGFIGSMIHSDKGNNITFGQILAGYFKKAGYSIVITSFRNNKIIRLIEIVYDIFTQHKKIDILILQVYSGLSFIIVDVASWVGKSLKIIMVFHVHGGNIPIFLKEHKSWVNRVFKRANFFVAPSNYLKISLERHGYNATCIPNFINIKDYRYYQRIRVKPKVIWLRAFHKIYNPSLAPMVIAKLNDYGIQANLTMIGPDKKDGSLAETQQIVDKLQVSNQITIIEGVEKNQVPEILSKGDIFLNTTNIDNAPVSVIEAMACGLCIVSTNVGGITYLLENEKDALLILPDDPAAMAAAVQRILTEVGLAERLSANARAKAEQYDWAAILPKWEKLFEEVIENAQ